MNNRNKNNIGYIMQAKDFFSTEKSNGLSIHSFISFLYKRTIYAKNSVNGTIINMKSNIFPVILKTYNVFT